MRGVTRRDPVAPSRVARFSDGVEEVELLGSGGVRARDALGVAAAPCTCAWAPPRQSEEEDELRRGSAAGACCWNTTAFSAGSGVGPVQKMELKGSSPSSSAGQQSERN